MDGGIQLRDEAVRDRIRAAEEFLDPSMWPVSNYARLRLTRSQTTLEREGTTKVVLRSRAPSDNNVVTEPTLY